MSGLAPGFGILAVGVAVADTIPLRARHAVGGVDAALLLYPVYLCVVNGMIALVIYERRRLLEGRDTAPCVVAAPTRPRRVLTG